jgi:hypothetical protein
MFGPVGVGFGWIVEREEFTPLGDEVLHWCRISFWHTDRANTFDAYGQTKALMKTKNGMMVDEDAPKKSLTDAITKAASQIGVAANIFLGRWDDSRYVAQVDAEYRREEQGQAREGRQVEQPKTLPERVDEAATADEINALIPEIKALNNAAASRHLHSRALSLGLVANKETGTYQPEQVAA